MSSKTSQRQDFDYHKLTAHRGHLLIFGQLGGAAAGAVNDGRRT
jgi:hypothetical protein